MSLNQLALSSGKVLDSDCMRAAIQLTLNARDNRFQALYVVLTIELALM
ncbi:hypothetical protein [Paraburkholderia sp. J8-2]|nr:hypothetical protein [Paraburkholderia sp. J8-2]